MGFKSDCHLSQVSRFKRKKMSFKNNFNGNSLKDKNMHNIINEAIMATVVSLEHASEFEPQKQGRSQDIINVISCKPKIIEDGVEIYEMELNKPIRGNDFLLRDKKHKKEYFANDDFFVEVYDKKNSYVYMKFKDATVKLDTGDNPNLELSFDLRILFINQGIVVEKHAFEIGLPSITPKVETRTGLQYVKTFEHPNLPVLNKEQKQSVHTILTKPFTSMEGPAGTGKTVTMSVPVISYMNAGKKIAIITPTRVALERSLSALVDMCRTVGIDTNKILLLGESSPWYAESYPETLESHDAQKFLASEELDLFLLEIALRYREMREIIEQKNESLTIEMLLKDLATNIDTLGDSLSTQEATNLQILIDIKIQTVKLAAVKVPEIRRIVGDLNYRNFYDRFYLFNLYMKNIQNEMTSDPLTKKERDMLRINKLKESSFGNRIEVYEELIGSKYNHLSEADINKQLIDAKIRIKRFKIEYAKKRFKNGSVVAMTADSYNSRFKNDPLVVDHIFIDEAGYMPLIKVYGICRANIPISLFGDTMQLPPISEMQNEISEDGKYESVMLYDMTAFHLETLFYEGYDGLKKAYFGNREPEFNRTPKVALMQTYRFGSKLANILDLYVYKKGFNSAIGDGGFKLQSVNAVNDKIPSRRVNPAEADAIRTLLKDGIEGSIAILTPYKNQVSHLTQKLKGLIDFNQIMSIHKSQGQEWDTIIISLVDYTTKGTHGMMYTDSTNKESKGLKIVNTAVSRAKKRLIIVGHEGFWIQQQDQLIGELFRNAEKLEVHQHGSAV